MFKASRLRIWIAVIALSPIVLGNNDCDGEPDTLICEAPDSDDSDVMDSGRQGLAARMSALWDVRDIPVCWLAESYDPAHEEERTWVFDQVEKTWGEALNAPEVPEHERFRFVGWTRCDEGNANGIRIRVVDDQPVVTFLGRRLRDDKGEMRLNFRFQNWRSWVCAAPSKMEYCIRAIAAHEFGHALGLTHEHVRPDSDESCTKPKQGASPSVLLGPYDHDSVMNYCASYWNNDGNLTQYDRQWIRVLYYPDHYEHQCFTSSRSKADSAGGEK